MKDSDNEWSSEEEGQSVDSDDSDDSDESMEEDNNKHKKKNKKLNPKTNSVGLSKRMVQQDKARDFFKDLWVRLIKNFDGKDVRWRRR